MDKRVSVIQKQWWTRLKQHDDQSINMFFGNNFRVLLSNVIKIHLLFTKKDTFNTLKSL